jgi:hypothetical protein
MKLLNQRSHFNASLEKFNNSPPDAMGYELDSMNVSQVSSSHCLVTPMFGVLAQRLKQL